MIEFTANYEHRLARYQQQQGVGGKTGVSDEPDTTKEVDLTKAHSLRCDDSIARQALQRMPHGHRVRDEQKTPGKDVVRIQVQLDCVLC